ncbi:glycosyltransferase family 39 protein [Parvicella tangerina]|uniref:Glycosyltransferase RgtA/B/C/D-like domain-containing protein n=1 Tax=Parvicella tangerina TaxID=2829795 RepID=A0A916JP41_9FLAO|nr:glycosyltransferase family 39 protein [Parvicella tangerina]CAG5084967.1 hypothetical protein CRYO30217_02612 [Parvicella tangerina]
MQTENKVTLFRKYWVDLTFLFVVILLFFLFGYYNHFSDGPGGIHYIRQTDSLAFIDHYQENDYNFFKPGTLNLDSEDGNAACEFPAIYYLTSFLYAGFGKHFFFLKAINLLISLYGLFHLLKLAEKLLKDKVYAILATLFFFTSTIYNYYIFNFLPDAAALGLTLIGWHLAYIAYQKRSASWLKPFILFTLAGLIKVTYFISPIAIVGFLLYENLLDKKRLHSLLPLLKWFGISTLIIVLWNLYVVFFNNYYETEYFTIGARPIWGMPESEVSKTWDHIFNYWFTDYLAHSSHHLIWAVLVLQLVFIKKIKKYAVLLGLLSLGAICYFLLFFSQFKDHDYYALTLFPILAGLLIGGIAMIKVLTQNKIIHLTTKALLTVIILTGINYSRNKVYNRLENRDNVISNMGIHLETQKEAVEKVIPEESNLLIIEDLSKNGGFISLDRKGWTLPSTEYFTKDTLDHYLNNNLDFIISYRHNSSKLDPLIKSYSEVLCDSLITIVKVEP